MAGYTPASILSTNLIQTSATYYSKEFVENLKANTPFLRVTKRREIPMNAGSNYKMYMYQTFAANLAQASEGVAGSGASLPTMLTNSMTLGQYADYVSVSDYALQTAIDDSLAKLEREFAYRLALTVSTIVRNTADTSSTVDGSVNSYSLTGTNVITKSVITAAIQSLLGRNVRPILMAENKFCGIIHPYAVGDLINDTNNNSYVDVFKHTAEGLDRLLELPDEDGMVPFLDFGGAHWYQSSIVTQTPNYLGQGGKTALRAYIFGEEAVESLSMGQREGTKVDDGDWHNLKLYLKKLDEPTVGNEARTIGGFCSYNLLFSSALVVDTTQRMRYIDAVSNVI